MVYEFYCENCESRSEILLRIDDPIPPCPECKVATGMVKLVSASPFILKGKGWFKTDGAGKKTYEQNQADNTPKTRMPQEDKRKWW